MTSPDDIGIKPVAYIQTNEKFGKELSFPEPAHRLTDADKGCGWSEMPLYSLADVSAELTAKSAALAAKDAEIAMLREYYQARQELHLVGLFNAEDKLLKRVHLATEALKEQAHDKR